MYAKTDWFFGAALIKIPYLVEIQKHLPVLQASVPVANFDNRYVEITGLTSTNHHTSHAGTQGLQAGTPVVLIKVYLVVFEPL